MPIESPNMLRAYLGAEQIKGLRSRNQLMGQQMETSRAFNQLAPQIMAGDEGATREAAGLDPSKTAAMMEIYGKMDDRQKAEAQETVQAAAKNMVLVRQADEAEQPQAWEWLRGNLPDDPDDPMPEQFDAFWLDRNIAEGMSLADIMKQDLPLSGPGKVQRDITTGALPEGTPLRGAGVTVNLPGEPQIGTIPPGYQAVKDDAGAWTMKPIPGGPEERKRAEEEAAAVGKKTLKTIQADIVIEDIGRSIKMIEEADFPITGFGSLLSAVPGTKAHDLSERLGTIKANIGFDRLQAMRDASPTGGALGQVSEFENKMLQATYGALAQSQSKEELLFNLRRLNETYLDIIHGPGNRPGQTGAGTGQQTQPAAAGDAEGDTATNPQTGEKLIFRNGQWVPVQ